ncbi:MAG: D-aminoacylase [Armatimonadota bacterium]|nr:D-aminoacylase [Armatimonadota bacterium]
MEVGHEYDVVILGGVVLDGSGTPGKRADVAVRGDRIAAVGNLEHASGAIHVDATGMSVCPGFIDIHTHSDLTILANPTMDSSILQGVTTEVTGNCGIAVGLSLDSPEFTLERRYASLVPGLQWTGMGEFLALLEERGVAANFMSLAGHNTIRRRAMGNEARSPTAAELATMKSVLRDALSEGAVGFSTGLEYPPGRYSKTDEIVELASVAAAAGVFYTSHLRNESDGLVDSVREALQIGEQAGLPVQLSHHKAEGFLNWGKVKETLGMVDAARARGQDVTLDQYPYTAFMTGLAIPVFPTWALGGSEVDMQERLANAETRVTLLAYIRALKMDWELVRIAIARLHREYQGQTIAELAHKWSVTPEEAVLRVLEDERGFVAATYFMMSEDDVQFVMQYPHTFVASDAATSSNEGPLSHDRPHPRTFGTFPRVLGRYVRELGVLPLETAIAKMTSMPAKRLGLTDRGVVKVGAKADLVVFDANKIIDQADDRNPRQEPVGIDSVFVNGQRVVHRGDITGALAGEVLCHVARS